MRIVPGTAIGLVAASLVMSAACGGATPPPDAPAPPPATPPSDVWSDPNEKPDGFALTPLFDKKKSKSSFPKKTASDADCWSTVGVNGDHTHDYDAIVAACGTPTGLIEYAHPIEGKLHHIHDPRDIYKLSLLGGYCYRYFAVADSGIADLDLLIEKPGGALVGDDKTNSPTAIIESDKPWCIDEDQTLEFHVQVDGPGSGGYLFGVWARPKR